MSVTKQKILEQAQRDGVQVTVLRKRVLDIVLKQSGVIKAYNILSQVQQQNEGVVAPPTAYCAFNFWTKQGVLRKVAMINGYTLYSHAQHGCGDHYHDHEETETHHSVFILVYIERGMANEQILSQEWAALYTGAVETGFSLKEEHVVLAGIYKKCQE